MDYYLHEENAYKRLLADYKKYKTLIVAFDFDGVISDFHNEGFDFSDVIQLLKDCNKANFKLVIYTANDKHNEIYKRCSDISVKIEGINKQLLPQFKNVGKIYYNILLDDRAGLATSYRILRRLLDDNFLNKNVFEDVFE